MSRRHRGIAATQSAITLPTHETELVRWWILRSLFVLGCSNTFLRSSDFEHDGLAVFLGLEELTQEYDAKKAMAHLRADYKKAEKISALQEYSPILTENIHCLKTLVDMSDAECKILVFLVLVHTDYLLSHVCCSWLDDLSTQSTFTVLSVLLEIEKEDVVKALSGKGKLIRCGLVSVDEGSCRSLMHRFDLLSGSFADRLLSFASTAEDFLLGMVKPSKAPTLATDDYRHIQREYRLLDQYLGIALENKKAGVNVLIYGEPGTGKSEMVRLLAKQVNAELLEVSSEDEQGDSLIGKTRLRTYKAAQQFFASRRTIILFDEIQDVFDDGGMFGRSTAELRKAEINTLLEENPLPTCWITNNIECMDAAFIRRFDIVVKLNVPPLRRRHEILQNAMVDLPVPAIVLKRFAKHEHLSPAVVNRATGVLRMVSGNMDDAEVPRLLESMFNQTLMAQGYKEIQKSVANALPDFYDPALINADVDLASLAAGIAANPSARICLYGPPGTGKSAFAQWLADQLQKPFHNKKLSDILSMWVGGTEKNLCKAFQEAEQDNAVLLLDEVDSFLQDRRQARQSWEVTQVNEMLVQMEAFNGVFIASTNLMENLDQAALRRFDLKIRLDYLKPEQAWTLFLAQCHAMTLDAPVNELKNTVHGMRLLTPGDFAAVQRRHRFSPIKDAQALLDGLKEECAVKEGGNTRRIGFV
jgi:transitional endoplasmic reticulum ATPase